VCVLAIQVVVLLEHKILFKDYLSAGAVSNIFTLICLTLFPYFKLTELPNLRILIECISAIFGSTLSTYLLKTKTEFTENSVLLYMGLTSYLYYMILSTLYGLWGTFDEDILMIVCFIIGGIVGKKIAKVKKPLAT
jgi:hypothetical protein